ncbi:TPA: hypothetical protein ACT9I4_001957 [Legionella pneumophila]
MELKVLLAGFFGLFVVRFWGNTIKSCIKKAYKWQDSHIPIVSMFVDEIWCLVLKIKLRAANKAQEKSEEELQLLKDEMEKTYGASDNAEELLKKIETAKEDAEAEIEKLRPIIEQEITPDNMMELEKQLHAVKKAQEKSQEELQRAEQEVALSLADLHEEPSVIVSQKLVAEINMKIKKPSQALYQYIERKFTNINTVFNYDINITENEIENIIGNISNLAEQEIPAKNYFCAFWYARQTASIVREKAYGKKSLEFDKLMARADLLDVVADGMHYSLMHSNLEEDILNILEKADIKWTKVKHIEHNPIYREMWLINKLVTEPSIETTEAYTNGSKNMDIINELRNIVLL